MLLCYVFASYGSEAAIGFGCVFIKPGAMRSSSVCVRQSYEILCLTVKVKGEAASTEPKMSSHTHPPEPGRALWSGLEVVLMGTRFVEASTHRVHPHQACFVAA